MKKILIISLVLLFVLLFLNGCNYTSGYFANVKITSQPDKAEVYINGVRKGETPVTIPLAYGEYDLRIVKEGYKEKNTKLVVKTDTEEFHVVLEKNKK
jgi:predicted small secreted protein